MASAATLEALRGQLPKEGLFADKDWLLSPEAFPIEPKLMARLERLGHQLAKFQEACNLLYHQSARGRQPAWIANYLDRGKPEWLVELSRDKSLREEVPQVIRPDIILTGDGIAITELDSVPGGIGLTAWLGRTYAGMGFAVAGGADGMLDGFAAIVPGGDIFVSPESATYRPEMEWLAARLNERELAAGGSRRWDVRDTGHYVHRRDTAYRFFELFDLPNLECGRPLLEEARDRAVRLTPPPKPYLEEKLWFGLFWLRPLEEFWKRQLGERYWRDLRDLIPYTWILDPEPLPHHAVLPGLEINDWSELAEFSQKQRELILKVSGFSEKAWGSRGVVMAQDVPQDEWRTTLRGALAAFDTSPHILQRFHKGRLVEHPFFERKTGNTARMRGRVRLCPYYFLEGGGAVNLRGVLATICPADKKLIHGMKDAILVPAAIAQDAGA